MPFSPGLQLATDSASKPGTNTWTILSDRRLKKNIRPLTAGRMTNPNQCVEPEHKTHHVTSTPGTAYGCRLYASCPLKGDPRMPSAKHTFDRTMKRAEGQITFYKRLLDVNWRKTKAPPQDELVEVVRTAVILGVSAFDAYFTDRFAEAFVPYIKKHGPTNGIISLLEEAGLDLRGALALLGMQRPYRRIRTIVDNHLDRHVTQRFDAIDKLFQSYGIKQLCSHAEKKVGRTKLLIRISKLIERRHAIVHNGDLTNHGQLRSINFNDVEKRLSDISLLVDSCDQIITSRAK